MHHGEIAEMGTFQDLMKKSGGFAHMMSEAQVEQDESHADGKNSQGKKEEPIVAAEETRSRPLVRCQFWCGNDEIQTQAMNTRILSVPFVHAEGWSWA